MQKMLYALGLSAVLTACLPQPETPTPNTQQVDAASGKETLPETEFNPAFAEYFAKVASDEMMGRAPATQGEERTVAYIEQQFARFGLMPYNADGYRQSVPVVQIDPVKVSALQLTAADGTQQQLAYRTDMMAWSTRMLPEINIEQSEMVFVGYGIVAPEYNWNDYADVDVTGKTVVILVNDPGYATKDPALFTGNAMTYYGRWTYKFEEAARQGAAMALIVHETDAASYGWNVVAGTSPIRFELADDNNNMHRAAAEGWITAETAAQLFATVGKDLAQMRALALSPDFTALPLPRKASLSINNNLRKLNSSNVVGYIAGSKYPDEAILYMAHWDHFGMDFSLPDNQVFNGAQDNAGGVAALLALAENFAKGPQPERSVAFLAVTVEERGLLGSRWYAENPLFATHNTVAGINMDVINVYGPMRDLMVFGYGSSELETLIVPYIEAQQRYIAPEPTPEDGFYYRSDHFSLARVGVPMFYGRGGVDSVAHGRDWGLAQRRKYVTDYYHKVTDEFDENWDLRGAQQDMFLYFHLGQQLANSRLWPKWHEGKEFKAVREAAMAEANQP